MFAYKDPKSDHDHKLKQDMDEALSLDLPEDTETVGKSLPGSSGERSSSYSFIVFQDYGLVNESEFTRHCKQTPAQAGLAGTSKKIQSLYFGFHGPGSRERYYLVGLESTSWSTLSGLGIGG